MRLLEFYEKALKAINARRARNNRARQLVAQKHPALLGIPMRFFVRPMDQKAKAFTIDIIEANYQDDCLDVTLKPVFMGGQLPQRIRRPY